MPAPGAAVRVVTVEGEFIAWGLFNPESAIRVRLYSWKEHEPLTDEFLAGLVARSVASRVRLFGDGPEMRACRLISSEGDSLSGLTVDRYGDFLLMQWTSLALSQREGLIAAELQKLLQPAGIWRRTDTGVMDKEGLPPSDGLVCGSEPPSDLTVIEHGVQYRVDIRLGQKTGFYFDQRDNRLAVARLCQGRTVLDVC